MPASNSVFHGGLKCCEIALAEYEIAAREVYMPSRASSDLAGAENLIRKWVYRHKRMSWQELKRRSDIRRLSHAGGVSLAGASDAQILREAQRRDLKMPVTIAVRFDRESIRNPSPLTD